MEFYYKMTEIERTWVYLIIVNKIVEYSGNLIREEDYGRLWRVLHA